LPRYLSRFVQRKISGLFAEDNVTDIIGVPVMVHLGGGARPNLPEFQAVAPEAEVERRRREDRDAEGLERRRVWGGGVPFPTGERSGEGAVPPPQKIFRFLSSRRRVLVHLWCYFLQLINLNLHIQIAKTFI